MPIYKLNKKISNRIRTRLNLYLDIHQPAKPHYDGGELHIVIDSVEYHLHLKGTGASIHKIFSLPLDIQLLLLNVYKMYRMNGSYYEKYYAQYLKRVRKEKITELFK